MFICYPPLSIKMWAHRCCKRTWKWTRIVFGSILRTWQSLWIWYGSVTFGHESSSICQINIDSLSGALFKSSQGNWRSGKIIDLVFILVMNVSVKGDILNGSKVKKWISYLWNKVWILVITKKNVGSLVSRYMCQINLLGIVRNFPTKMRANKIIPQYCIKQL